MKYTKSIQSRLSFFVWSAFIILIIVASCAKPVSPTGGPKDETPPIVTESEPANYSTGFNTDEIKVSFNEFVQLEGVNQKLIVSPPLNDDPEVDTRGKSVIIEIPDTLKKNTTYTFYFADAIVDLHESNPLENFQFVFSTGNEIDSMKVSGKVEHAFSQKPMPDIYVMLYTDMADSVPMKQRPYYLTKTDKKGRFTLTNLKNTDYKIFALNDVNSNYLYDLPNEKIAFSDSVIHPEEVSEIRDFKTLDTTRQDTTKSEADSLLSADTAGVATSLRDTLTLRLFRDRDTVLKNTTATMKKNKRVLLGFNKPVDSLILEPMQPANMDSGWYIPEWNPLHDSVQLWLTDFNSDSLTFRFKMKDIGDTLTFTYFEKEDEPDPTPPLAISPILETGNQIPAHPLRLNFSRPLKDSITHDSLYLYSMEDTTTVSYRITGLRQVTVKHKWNEEMNYRLYIPDSTFWDVYGKGNDSSVVKFSTKPPRKYGELIVNTTVPDTSYKYIVQLMSKDEKQVYKRLTISKDTTMQFRYLNPDKYKLKAIFDRNKNTVWDAGLYIKHEQPEEISYYPKPIEVIANWEVEIDWKIKP